MTATPETAHEPAERLRLYLDRTGIAARRPTVTALAGDASDRRYFRVSAAGEPSQVAAVHSASFVFEELPFVIVGRLLEAMPVRVPRVLGHDEELGVLMLVDLGDVTLQAKLATASQAERSSLYRDAIRIITTLQRRGRQLASPDLLPYQLAFDVEKLMFELRFFTSHFLEAHRGVILSDTARTDLEREFASIAQALAAEPRVFCHRDYHSRNLMLCDGHLHVIDFQDARMGPDTYDLVSLLRDAYVDFAHEEVDELVAAFLAASQIGGAAAGDFWRRFDLMTVQRTLKALGTFGFQATSRGNDRYLENVPRTLTVLRGALAAHARFSPLQRQLSGFIPELA
jgi:aminoglycoside/choline kinase family phosphotransferase